MLSGDRVHSDDRFFGVGLEPYFLLGSSHLKIVHNFFNSQLLPAGGHTTLVSRFIQSINQYICINEMVIQLTNSRAVSRTYVRFFKQKLKKIDPKF